MKRDKRRFDQKFLRRKWEKRYWHEYHASMWRRDNDGYYRLLTTEEHRTFWERNHRETVKRINGICGKPSRRIA